MCVALRLINADFWRILKVAILKMITYNTTMGHLKYTHGVKSKGTPICCYSLTQSYLSEATVINNSLY